MCPATGDNVSHFRILVVCALVFPCAGLLLAQGPSETITVHVDASDAGRRLLKATLRIAVQPGPCTLYYPKWIPGEHAPTGPITDLAGLQITAAGKEIAWQRDEVDMYAFHCKV